MNGPSSDAYGSAEIDQKANALTDHAASVPLPEADFELSKRMEGGWRLHILTTRGMHWSHANFVELIAEDCILSLPQANAFLGQARKFGLKTHYIGPNGRTLL